MNQFIKEVNRIVEGRFGFGVHDFADFPFFDYYDEDAKDHDFERMVKLCAEDFIDEQECEYGLGGMYGC